MITKLILCALTFGAVACAKPAPTVVRIVEPVEVSVPVPIERTPPAELLAPVTAESPVFVAPTDPEASSALTAEGERLLRALIEVLLSRDAAWRAWALPSRQEGP